VDRRDAALLELVFVIGERLINLRDLLLLLVDELLDIGDLLASVVGRDTAAVAVVAALAGGEGFAGSQNSSGACELGTR
jgi:hypothetical protein